jgi:hypothetical protein
VQQPHWPWGAQPSFTSVSPSVSRRASSKVPAASTSTRVPLTRKETAAGAWGDAVS